MHTCDLHDLVAPQLELGPQPQVLHALHLRHAPALQATRALEGGQHHLELLRCLRRSLRRLGCCLGLGLRRPAQDTRALSV